MVLESPTAVASQKILKLTMSSSYVNHDGDVFFVGEVFSQQDAQNAIQTIKNGMLPKPNHSGQEMRTLGSTDNGTVNIAVNGVSDMAFGIGYAGKVDGETYHPWDRRNISMCCSTNPDCAILNLVNDPTNAYLQVAVTQNLMNGTPVYFLAHVYSKLDAREPNNIQSMHGGHRPVNNNWGNFVGQQRAFAYQTSVYSPTLNIPIEAGHEIAFVILYFCRDDYPARVAGYEDRSQYYETVRVMVRTGALTLDPAKAAPFLDPPVY